MKGREIGSKDLADKAFRGTQIGLEISDILVHRLPLILLNNIVLTKNMVIVIYLIFLLY